MFIIFLLFAFLMSFLTIMAIKENLGLYQEIFKLENEIKKKDEEIFKKELFLKMIKQDRKMKEIFNDLSVEIKQIINKAEEE